MLQVSFHSHAVFSSRFGASAFSFIRLRRDEPDVAAVIEKVCLSNNWPRADLYSVTVGNKRQQLVFVAADDERELVYPAQVDDGLENHLLLNATLKAQHGLLKFLWQEEGGWVLMFFYPPFGVLVTMFGWELLSLVPRGPSASLALFVSGFLIVMGVMLGLTPVAYSWLKRSQLRKALKELAIEELRQDSESPNLEKQTT